MTRTSAHIRARGLIGLVAALSLVAALALPAGAATEHCPDGGTKTEANGGTQAAINNLVLDAGTEFCVKAGTEATGMLTADGVTTLQDYLLATGILDGSGEQGRDVSYYIVYAAATPTPTPAEEEEDNAALNIRKVDDEGNRLEGAVFTVEGMEGTFTTGANGKFCITGLPEDSEWLVTEIQAPEGYEIGDEPSQLVEVDDDGSGLCDSPDAVFVNTLAEEESPTPTPTPKPDEGEEGGTPTPTPSPRQGELGGNPTPRGGVQGGVPDTAMQVGSNAGLPMLLALLLTASLVGLGYLNVLSARARNNR